MTDLEKLKALYSDFGIEFEEKEMDLYTKPRVSITDVIQSAHDGHRMVRFTFDDSGTYQALVGWSAEPEVYPQEDALQREIRKFKEDML